MKRCLLDTNILVRMASPRDSLHFVATTAVTGLQAAGSRLYVYSQSLIEFRVVATRPTNVRGLGMSSLGAKQEMVQFLTNFGLVPDSPAVFDTWRNLVERVGTIGKPNHDARILAFAMEAGCSHLLTFNTQDFVRYTGSGIQITDPANV